MITHSACSALLRRVVPLLLLGTIPPPLAAATYFVATTGSDANPGTQTAPFRTLGKAADRVSAGDIVLIRAGTYRETLTISASGKATAPIRFAAFQGEPVVVSATETVGGWQPHAGAIYKATNTTMPLGDRNMLYFDGAAQQLARWPNDTDGNPYTYDARKIKTTAGSFSTSFITHDDIPGYWTSGVMFWLGAHSGCAVQRTITGYDPATHRLSFATFPDQWPFSAHGPARFENGHRGIFYLLNRLEALDAPREWYYDANAKTLYYHAPDGGDPSSGRVEVAVRNRTLSVTGSHVAIENLSFFGGPLLITGSSVTLSHLNVKHGVAGLITDDDNAVAGGAAVQVRGDDIRIERSLIEEGSASGVDIAESARRAVIENCVIRNFNTQGNHCSPLRSAGPAARITRNRISGSARDCVRVTGRDSVFSYNHVSDGLLANTDGGLFYVTGNSQPVNVEVHHNWFHRVHSPSYTSNHSTGIYLDNNSAGYRVHHNVVWDVAWGGLHFNWNAVQNEIYNNTFWDVGHNTQEKRDWAVILSWIPVKNGKQTNVQKNVLLNNVSDVRQWWDSGAGTGASKMTEDETKDNTFRRNLQVTEAAFVAPREGNFQPVAGGPLVDKGEVIPGITDGYKGAAPDVGAYEAGTVPWVPGPDWKP